MNVTRIEDYRQRRSAESAPSSLLQAVWGFVMSALTVTAIWLLAVCVFSIV